jgi:hypothetical protein
MPATPCYAGFARSLAARNRPFLKEWGRLAMSTHAQNEQGTATADQLQRELQLLIQRHAEFSRRLEAILNELQAQPTAGAAGAALPGSSTQPAEAPARMGKELARLNDRISHMEEQFDSLWRQLGVNSARIQEILDSRTWKFFTGMGGIVLKLVGRR